MKSNEENATRGRATAKQVTPLKVIRLKCLDCSAGQQVEVRLCPVTACPLWRWRFGKRPQTVAAKRPELLDANLILEKGGVGRDFDTDVGTDPEAGLSPRRSESRPYATISTLEGQGAAV